MKEKLREQWTIDDAVKRLIRQIDHYVDLPLPIQWHVRHKLRGKLKKELEQAFQEGRKI